MFGSFKYSKMSESEDICLQTQAEIYSEKESKGVTLDKSYSYLGTDDQAKKHQEQEKIRKAVRSHSQLIHNELLVNENKSSCCLSFWGSSKTENRDAILRHCHAIFKSTVEQDKPAINYERLELERLLSGLSICERKYRAIINTTFNLVKTCQENQVHFPKTFQLYNTNYMSLSNLRSGR